MYLNSESLKPKFDHRSRIFELDPCDGFGKVCLIYRNTRAGRSRVFCAWAIVATLLKYYISEYLKKIYFITFVIYNLTFFVDVRFFLKCSGLLRGIRLTFETPSRTEQQMHGTACPINYLIQNLLPVLNCNLKSIHLSKFYIKNVLN